MAAMPGSMARSLVLPNPITRLGAAAADGSERNWLIGYTPTRRSRAAAATASSSAVAGRWATAWNPAARPVTRTAGACRARAAVSAARRAA
jgi:hypothetical protein